MQKQVMTTDHRSTPALLGIRHAKHCRTSALIELHTAKHAAFSCRPHSLVSHSVGLNRSKLSPQWQKCKQQSERAIHTACRNNGTLAAMQKQQASKEYLSFNAPSASSGSQYTRTHTNSGGCAASCAPHCCDAACRWFPTVKGLRHTLALAILHTLAILRPSPYSGLILFLAHPVLVCAEIGKQVVLSSTYDHVQALNGQVELNGQGPD